MSEYLRRGVSPTKDEVHRAIKGLDKGLYPKSFCKILPDYLGQDSQWCSIIHADGAGSKTSLAYAYWRETGDLSVWRNIAVDALVMNLDDLLCVGSTGPFLLSSTICRNSRLIPGEVLEAIIGGTLDFIEHMKSFGIEIIHGGGETADLGDLVRTVVVDATFTTRMPKKDLITNEKINEGDVVVGLCSFGQSSYEGEYNGGMGSNGLTSARHDIFNRTIKRDYPETFDPQMPEDLVYRGEMNLLDEVEDTPLNAGKLVLSPTRTYAPVLAPILREKSLDIHGMIHCTGGGQTKVLNFLEGLRVVKDNLFPLPPLFRLIKTLSGSSEMELYQVFNMGHRLEVYLPDSDADILIDRAISLGVDARKIGRVEKSPRPQVLIKTEDQNFLCYNKD
jgi:phosphoribosylformylglycinamidine cyclo-ligase